MTTATTQNNSPSMAMKPPTREEALELVRGYGFAWESQDSRCIGRLFSRDAVYKERPGRIMVGLPEIEKYWREQIGGRESGVRFHLYEDEFVFDPTAFITTQTRPFCVSRDAVGRLIVDAKTFAKKINLVDAGRQQHSRGARRGGSKSQAALNPEREARWKKKIERTQCVKKQMKKSKRLLGERLVSSRLIKTMEIETAIRQTRRSLRERRLPHFVRHIAKDADPIGHGASSSSVSRGTPISNATTTPKAINNDQQPSRSSPIIGLQSHHVGQAVARWEAAFSSTGRGRRMEKHIIQLARLRFTRERPEKLAIKSVPGYGNLRQHEDPEAEPESESEHWPLKISVLEEYHHAVGNGYAEKAEAMCFSADCASSYALNYARQERPESLFLFEEENKARSSLKKKKAGATMWKKQIAKANKMKKVSPLKSTQVLLEDIERQKQEDLRTRLIIAAPHDEDTTAMVLSSANRTLERDICHHSSSTSNPFKSSRSDIFDSNNPFSVPQKIDNADGGTIFEDEVLDIIPLDELQQDDRVGVEERATLLSEEGEDHEVVEGEDGLDYFADADVIDFEEHPPPISRETHGGATQLELDELQLGTLEAVVAPTRFQQPSPFDNDGWNVVDDDDDIDGHPLAPEDLKKLVKPASKRKTPTLTPSIIGSGATTSWSFFERILSNTLLNPAPAGPTTTVAPTPPRQSSVSPSADLDEARRRYLMKSKMLNKNGHYSAAFTPKATSGSASSKSKNAVSCYGAFSTFGRLRHPAPALSSSSCVGLPPKKKDPPSTPEQARILGVADFLR
ncbi:unnamed protein product [Amoebophrya sp. A25]|nr:unnamed protein product [Amoebophrya sp. A25]|eukprot:GSA25T00007923001.1